MTLQDMCIRLLPPHPALSGEVLGLTAEHLIITAALTTATACCPTCGQPATRLHSTYQRTLTDLPWAVVPVELRVRVRRFRCDTRSCRRQTFAEPLDVVAARSARTTARLTSAQTDTGLALGGAAGARLLARRGLPGSRNTLLRRVRRATLPDTPAPQVVGIDDWAWHKGQQYGTILVDLQRGRPIDLLADRATATVAAWFQAHPTVEVVARDRAEAYAAGIAQGAPTAVQVADRFHLFLNVAEALEQVLGAHTADLDAINTVQRQAPVPLADGTLAVPVPLPPQPATVQQTATQRRTQRVALYEQVWALHRQGMGGHAIARHLGIGKSSVFRYLRTPTFPERKQRRDRGQRSILAPYKERLLAFWNAGCHEALALFRFLTQQGYTGSYATIARYARRLRQAQGLPARPQPVHRPVPPVAEPTTPPLTVRRAAALILKRDEKRTPEDTQQLARLQAQHAEMAEAMVLTQDFAQMVRQRQPDQLDPWLERATQSALTAFQRFAASLRADAAAVKAALTLPWSTGPVEGHINRLKMLKRQMFGRAGVDLLRQRLLAPP
jgi:transposase